MAKRRGRAKDAHQDRGNGEIWIIDAEIAPDDLEWLRDVKRLTLLNTLAPSGFLAQLRSLWWLDLRGGTAKDVSIAEGCKKLRYLALGHVRGLADLGVLTTFKTLELLSLYALAQVTEPISLRPLTKLARLEVGQMRGLSALGAFLDAPKLEELYLHRRVPVTPDDLARIERHRTLRAFGWSAEDVPDKVAQPVLQRITLPDAKAMFPIDWFAARQKT